MFEGSIADLSIHLLTTVLAGGLMLVSFRAYRRNGGDRFAFICAGFGLFFLKELVLILNIFYINAALLTGGAHALNLVILLLFFYGVSK